MQNDIWDMRLLNLFKMTFRSILISIMYSVSFFLGQIPTNHLIFPIPNINSNTECYQLKKYDIMLKSFVGHMHISGSGFER